MRLRVWALLTIGLAALPVAPAWADADRTSFTGTETVTGGLPPTIIPAGSKFHVLLTQSAVEVASDPRVSGDSTIGLSAIWELPAMVGPMWGTWRVVNAGGEWNGYWQGSRTLTPEGIATSIVGTARGSGAYAGLTARWDIRGLNVGPDNPYLHYDGFIVEAREARAELPMTWRATRTESLNVATLEFLVLSEAGQGTRIGRAGNTGFGFIVPTGQPLLPVTGMGRLTAANGDQLYWVVSGEVTLADPASVTVSVHFTGGDGRFDDAVGQVNGSNVVTFGPPDPDGIALATYGYRLSGTITY